MYKIFAGAASSDVEKELFQIDNDKKARVHNIVNQGRCTKQKSKRTYSKKRKYHLPKRNETNKSNTSKSRSRYGK